MTYGKIRRLWGVGSLHPYLPSFLTDLANCSSASRSQTLIVRSLLPEKSHLPSPLTARDMTASACPRSLRISLPDCRSHTVISPKSSPPQYSRLLSGLSARLLGRCAGRVKIGIFFSRSHIRMVRSASPEKSHLPSGLMAKQVTPLG